MGHLVLQYASTPQLTPLMNFAATTATGFIPPSLMIPTSPSLDTTGASNPDRELLLQSFEDALNSQTSRHPDFNYICPVCSKTFQNKKDFRRHYMIHTGEKPFSCPHCSYRARLKSNMKAHIFSRHCQDNTR